jgi:probable 2-oxoglutarate dehydrogenase E1 component DHKTD1
MAPGTSFQPVLEDPSIQDPSKVEKVVFLSGKFYYDLVKERENRGLNDKVALIRVEELSPFPKQDLQEQIAKFSDANEFVWCQEEPQNAGAYAFMAPRLAQLLPNNKVSLNYVQVQLGLIFFHRQSSMLVENLSQHQLLVFLLCLRSNRVIY